MPLARKWTEAEDALLTELWPQQDLSLAELGRQMGDMYPDTIKARAERLGLEKRVFRKWPPNRKAMLVRLWGAGHTAAEICRKMPEYSRDAITSKLDRLGLLNGVNRNSNNPSPHRAPITLVASVRTRERFHVNTKGL